LQTPHHTRRFSRGRAQQMKHLGPTVAISSAVRFRFTSSALPALPASWSLAPGVRCSATSVFRADSVPAS
jgi:hypothetical protein